ncbi:MAG: hypothetical protein PF574_03035 [Candidatus Delongbacteria bacterium]|nr:hypothetical protein [Candidatus Delongbacteria bacterium]
MLSQPFLISIILILFGFDANYVLMTATITHLYFLYYVPSGATKYPEYPFAFFVVIASSKLTFGLFENSIGALVLLSFTLIIVFSRITAHYVYFKRKMINRFIDTPKEATIRYYMLFSVVSSFISGSIYAFLLIFLSSEVIRFFSGLIKFDINVNNLIIVITIGIFAPYFFSKKKLKAVTIGIILAAIFYIIIR